MNRCDCFRAQESDTIEYYLVKNIVYIIERRHKGCGHPATSKSLNRLEVPVASIAFLLTSDLLN